MTTVQRESANTLNAPPEPDAGDPGKLDRGLIVLASVLVLGLFMSVLDTTIVNVALDTVGRELGATLSAVQWVITGYLLALAMVIPLSGWAIERFGAKRVWISSLALFVAGSALSGAAWSIGSLIGFRVLQGLGGGMILPTAMSLLATAAGPTRMGRVMSVVFLPGLLGPVLGPVIGGLLVQNVSWHWIFYVNVPVGLLALALAAKVLPPAEGRGGGRLDLRGLVLASGGLTTLIYGLTRADSAGGFGDASVYGWLVAAAVLIAAFVAHSLGTGPAALIDVRLFTDRRFSAAALTSFFMSFGLYAGLLLLPLYYQTVRGEGALGAGLMLVPQGIGAAIAMPVAGMLTDRIGARRVVIPGVIISAVGAFAFTQVTADTSYTLLSAALFVSGIGLGLTVMPAIAAAYGTLTRSAVPRATTALNIVQRVGGALGASVVAVVLVNRLAAALPARTGGLAAAVGASLQAHGPLAGLFATAFAQTFWVAFGMTAIIVVPALFLPATRGRRRPPVLIADIEAVAPEHQRE